MLHLVLLVLYLIASSFTALQTPKSGGTGSLQLSPLNSPAFDAGAGNDPDGAAVDTGAGNDPNG